MFKRMLLRFRDMKTISKLISGADEQAGIVGEEKPGAEHFILSALQLEDGTAKRAFERLSLNSEVFKRAVKRQYQEALSSVGISHGSIDVEVEPLESDKMFHSSQPSGQELMKSLYALKQEDKDCPLLGVHVISVASRMEHGVVARAFKVLGIDRESLAKAANEELDLYR